MFSVRTSTHQYGVTLIELIITLVVLAILLMLGMPSFAEWIQNTQIRTATESIMTGLQTARNEAVRRNTNVVFNLTEIGATGGTGWTVTLASGGGAIQSAAAGEGARNAVVTTAPTDADSITFTGFGRTPAPPNNKNPDGSDLLTQIDVDSSAMTAADSRNLRILISPGGQIRMCDPNVSTTGDPRKC